MTTDIVMVQTGKVWDAVLNSDGDLSSGDFFDSSLVYSLLGERRASSSEVPASQHRRGWIGNEGTDFENGSKLWIYSQERITRSLLNSIQSTALDCLQWLVDFKYLINVSVVATLVNGVVTLEISLFRPSSKVDRRFFPLWENTGAQ